MIVPAHAALLEERRADGWSGGATYPPGQQGLEYRCQECGSALHCPSGARKHERTNPGHVVLRVDWFEPGYFAWVKQVRLEAGRLT